jgi:hypothetical protein
MNVAHIVFSAGGGSFPTDLAAAMVDTKISASLVVLNEADPDPDIPTSVVDPKLSQPESYRALLADLDKNGFDIVHTHHNRSAAAVGILNKL